MSSATDNSWIAPWSQAVTKAAEAEKRNQRRRSSFLSAEMGKPTLMLADAKSHTMAVNAFAQSAQLPVPPRLQRIFFSPHPDDVAYSAYGTASRRPACCHHHDDDTKHDERDQVKVAHGDQTMLADAIKKVTQRLQQFDVASLPSPALSTFSSSSSSSLYSDDATLLNTPSSSASSVTSSGPSRRNSADDVRSAFGASDDGQNALIVTVFSQSRCANGEIGARLNRNVDDTTALRTLEDEAFARSIGCDLLQLGFPDSSARDEPSRRPDLAEAAIAGAAGTKIQDVDHYIYQDVRRALEPIVWMAVRAGAKIHLPLGVGCHVDHWMVRVAVLSILDELDAQLTATATRMTAPVRRLFSTHVTGGEQALHERLIFYEDLPYADAQTNKHVEGLARGVLPLGAKAKLVHLTEAEWCKKRAAILAYKSQMKPTIIPSLYNHATRLAYMGKTIDPNWSVDATKAHMVAERIWIIDGELRRKALLERQEEQQA